MAPLDKGTFPDPIDSKTKSEQLLQSLEQRLNEVCANLDQFIELLKKIAKEIQKLTDEADELQQKLSSESLDENQLVKIDEEIDACEDKLIAYQKCITIIEENVRNTKDLLEHIVEKLSGNSMQLG